MGRDELVDLLTESIAELDKGFIQKYGWSLETCEVDEEGVYIELSYQVDDRKGREDDKLEKSLEEKFGEDYGVDLNRVDAYPDGRAHYRITIDS